MELLRDLASWILILGGAFFSITGGIGLLRLPDVYARMHAAGMIDTLGATLILGGFMIQAGFSLVTVKLGLILIFLFFTSPTATYALANAAYRSGLEPLTGTPPSVGDEPPAPGEQEPS